MSILCQKFHSFFKISLHHQYDEDIISYNNLIILTVDRMNTFSILLLSKSSHIDLPKLYIKSNCQWSKYISQLSIQFIIKIITIWMHLMISELNLFSEMSSGYMKKENVEVAFLSLSIFCSKSFNIFWIFSMTSISKQYSAWHLPNSYNLVNLHEILGTRSHRNLMSPESILHSTMTDQLY